MVIYMQGNLAGSLLIHSIHSDVANLTVFCFRNECVFAARKDICRIGFSLSKRRNSSFSLGKAKGVIVASRTMGQGMAFFSPNLSMVLQSVYSCDTNQCLIHK